LPQIQGAALWSTSQVFLPGAQRGKRGFLVTGSVKLDLASWARPASKSCQVENILLGSTPAALRASVR
jgi:hypothetical protein